MDLSKFVMLTIQQIVSGIEESRTFVEHHRGGRISPADVSPSEVLMPIAFDVAVTTSEESSGGAGGGITVWGVVKADGKTSTSQSQNTVSRIQFSVPILLKSTHE